MERLFPGGRVAPRLPLVQAPMAGAQSFRLAAAVVKAGGVGSIPCAMLSPAQVRHDVSEFLKSCSRLDHLNLNFFAHKPPTPCADVLRRWSDVLEPFRKREGLPPAASLVASGALNFPPSRQPFNQEMARLIEELRPGIVSFHFGLPDVTLLEHVRRAGCLVWSSATTVEEADFLEKSGLVDAVLVQGLEAGGHRGHFLGKIEDQMHTRGQDSLLALLRNIRATRRFSLPLIAAGGIATAMDAQAALQNGADAVQAGTAFLLCPESEITTAHRTALERAITAAAEHREKSIPDAAADETQLTNLFSGGLARGLRNLLMRELGPVSPDAPPFPLASAALVDLRKAAERDCRGDYSPLWAGQGYARCLPNASAEHVCRQFFP